MLAKRPTRLLILFVTLECLGGCGLITPSHHRIRAYTAIFQAADACDLITVRKAVAGNSGLLTETEWDDATLLHNAVGHNCTDLTAYLLQQGANVNAVRTDGIAPLHLAAQRGNIKIADMLLQRGARINAIDSKGWTPVDRAKNWNHPDMVSFLEQRGAN